MNFEHEDNYTVGQKMADAVAKFGGSWTFVLLFAFGILIWVSINTWILLTRDPFDPYPFILLNLFLSCLAAVQAPIIMMSQNRQAEKDRRAEEIDYEVNRRAEQEINEMQAKLDEILAMIEEQKK